MKLIVGWFSFTCSEDSTIVFTELLNDHFDQWKNLIEFRHLNALKMNNQLDYFDVAFIEGAISSPTQAEKAKLIREKAKYVVAIGACACTGKPSDSRNSIPKAQRDYQMLWYYSQFDYSDQVRKLDEVIKVDDYVRGCPMDQKLFLQVMDKYLKLFKIIYA